MQEQRSGWPGGASGGPEPACLSCRLASVPEVTTESTGRPAPDTDGPDQAAVEAELARAKERLLEQPADLIVANHAMGLFELGALHLTSSPPNLTDAVLAIDAMACLVEGLEGRLGPDEATLRTALEQIRLAFVQVKASLG